MLFMRWGRDMPARVPTRTVVWRLEARSAAGRPLPQTSATTSSVLPSGVLRTST
jgi:hypothetical protein